MGCAKFKIKFGAKSLDPGDMQRGLIFSLYAFKGRIANSDNILKLKNVSVSVGAYAIDWLVYFLEITTFRGTKEGH